MTTVFGALQNAASALQAYGTRQAATADAIANVTTRGYRQTSVVTNDIEPGGVQAVLRGPQAAAPAVGSLALANDVSLEGSMVDLIINQQSHAANVATARAAADMAETLNTLARA